MDVRTSEEGSTCLACPMPRHVGQWCEEHWKQAKKSFAPALLAMAKNPKPETKAMFVRMLTTDVERVDNGYQLFRSIVLVLSSPKQSGRRGREV